MYTQAEITKILQNKYVIKCSKTNITYSKEFKIKAVKEYYEEGMSPNMIFREAGFEINVLPYKTSDRCLNRWRKIYNEKGKDHLMKETRGAKKKIKIIHKTDKEKIEYLEDKIAYLDAENDFLAELRGLKRE